MNRKLIAALFIAFIICMPYSILMAVFNWIYDKTSILFVRTDNPKQLVKA
jgi:hypothetical protein